MCAFTPVKIYTLVLFYLVNITLWFLVNFLGVGYGNHIFSNHIKFHMVWRAGKNKHKPQTAQHISPWTPPTNITPDKGIGVQPPYWDHPKQHCNTQFMTYSTGEHSLGAPRKRDGCGQKKKYGKLLSDDYIAWPCPQRQLHTLLSKLRRKCVQSKQRLWSGTQSKITLPKSWRSPPLQQSLINPRCFVQFLTCLFTCVSRTVECAHWSTTQLRRPPQQGRLTKLASA